jgi:FemAB family
VSKKTFIYKTAKTPSTPRLEAGETIGKNNSFKLGKIMEIKILDVYNPLWSETLENIKHDIYHLPSYFLLEANRTKTIPEAITIQDGDKILFAPYLLRSCDEIIAQGASESEIYDTFSPNGYTGILLNEAAINTPEFANLAMGELKRTLSDKGVCSAFFRLHPILNENFSEIFTADTATINGETVSVDLRLTESQIWAATRSGHKSTINKCKRLGMTARIVPASEYLDEFTEIYLETMERVGATKGFYSFDYEYYNEMQQILGDKLFLCIVDYENEVACAGLYTEVCGIVQSTLGGTRNNVVHLSPSSLETDYARYWAKERGNNFLHLGGGVGASQDSVYSFKAGFSKLRHTFMTLRLIINEAKYHYLVEQRAKTLNTEPLLLLQSDFFPAYRSNI